MSTATQTAPDEGLPEIYWNPWETKHIDVPDAEFHCVPLRDTRGHILNRNCFCVPVQHGERQTNGGNLLPFFLHHSADMRELDEWFFYNIQHSELGYTDNDIYE